jgi:hypothetical protein
MIVLDGWKKGGAERAVLLKDASPRHTAMDSLPDQHIDSLPKDARKDAYRQVGMVCAHRFLGLSKDEVAKKAKFRSVDDMYFRLKRWGLSGLLPLEEEAKATPKTTRKRAARGSGPVIELPPADNATPLFRAKLEELLRATEELQHRKEKLQNGRFIQSSVYTDPTLFSRKDLSDEQWQQLSELYNLDPEAKRFMHFGEATFSLGGGNPAPQAPLPALIAAYLLAGGELEPLTETLHPDPASAEWPKIEKRIEGRKGTDNLDGLKALAEQLARAIRGGTLGPGSPGAELSPDEINLASRITERREAQVPDEQIYEELRHLRRSEELSWDEFRRLADLGLRFPWM